MSWRDKVAPVDESYMDAMKATSKSSGGDVKWVGTPYNGTYIFRVLPPGRDGRWAFKKGTHFDLPNPKQDSGQDGDKAKTNALCVEFTFPELKRECPICNVLREAARLGLNVEPWEPSIKTHFNVLVKLTPPGDWDCGCPHRVVQDATGQPAKVTDHKGIHLLSHTEYTMEWLDVKRKDTAVYGDFMDPMEGRDFRVTRSKKGSKTEYARELLPDKSPLAATDEEIEALLDQRVEFSKYWTFPNDEELQRIITISKMLRTMLLNRAPGSSPVQPLPRVESVPPPGAAPSVVVTSPVVSAPVVAPVAATPAPAPSGPPQPMLPDKVDDGRQILWIRHDYPQCFADKNVYKKDKDQAMKCTACPYEFECTEDAKKLDTNMFVLKRK